jgi:flagellar basal body-associated protein FliL
VPAEYGRDDFRSLFQEDSMAEKNRKKTYLILIVILLVVILIAYL